MESLYKMNQTTESGLDWFLNFISNNRNNISNNFSSPFPKDFLKRPPIIIALLLGVGTLILNASALLAMRIGKQNNAKLSANVRLLISLSWADICVAVSVFWQIIISSTNIHDQYYCLQVFHRSFRSFSHSVTLLNLCCLAIDHYIAILKPLHHPDIMSTGRLKTIILLTWLLSFLIGISDFLPGKATLSNCQNGSFCQLLLCDDYDSEYFVFALTPFSLIVMCVLYSVIFNAIKAFNNISAGRRSKQMEKNRKGLITTMLILGTFCACFLPYCIFEVWMIIGMKVQYRHPMYYFKLIVTLDFYFYDLLLLNSFTDPIIYAIRMKKVRRGYGKIFRFICPSAVSRIFKMKENNQSTIRQNPSYQPVRGNSNMTNTTDHEMYAINMGDMIKPL